MGKRWTDEEIDFLKEYYGVMDFDEMAKRLGRAFGAVKRKGSYLGLSNKKSDHWSKEENEYIFKHHKTMSYKAIAKKLGRTYLGVKAQGRRLGIDKNEFISDVTLRGQRFGGLTAIERVFKEKRYWWMCKCECGKEKLVSAYHLKSGKVKSCGCRQRISRSKVAPKGKYGKWTVISKTEKRHSSGSIIWLCKCQCGTIKEVNGNSLYSGASKSCGCITREMMSSKTGEKNHNYKPSLTEEDRMERRYILNGESSSKVRMKVYERDNYTCKNCQKRGGELNAHHLNSWNTHPEERFEVDNCITLCAECHTDFHKKCGYGDNTKEQFEEYYKEKQRKGVR